MTTVLNVATIVTARDLDLFRTLTIARVLDGEQIKVVGGFRSTRRTNRRLLKLVRSGLLRRWFVGAAGGGQKAIYGLSPQGASLIGETRQGLIRFKHDSLIMHSEFLAHQHAVNAVFILAKFQPMPAGLSCKKWMNFREPFSPSVPLMPDGYFEIAKEGSVHPMFLEVDLGSERSPVWQRKVELYLKFAIGGEFERLFHLKRFRVLVVLPSEKRLEAVRRTIAKCTEKLFWLSTQDELNGKGLCSSIWLRPVGAERIPLV